MIASFLLAASQAMTFTADRIVADGVTRALSATGHIVAAAGPVTIRGEAMSRATDGTMLFSDPVCVTTCTNDVGHTHWNVSGEVEYKDGEYVILRNMKLRLWEVPVLWLPYMWYPLDLDCGFSWMPGYTGRWGAYLLTKADYDLLGDSKHGPESWWLKGATRFDLRYRQGLAFGEDLDWNLGDFGHGGFNVYYAWDEDVDWDRDIRSRDPSHRSNKYHQFNWQSPIHRDRYSLGLRHRWEATERDTVRLNGTILSDSRFRSDFMRRTLFNWKSQWLGYDTSGVFWEHVENAFAVGAEVSGRLNDFYGMTDRLPELYVDVSPQPLFGLPVNYESENRFGYLRRNPAEYGDGDPASAYSYRPGPWADYETFRIDTYHRLTAPFRTCDDLLATVPRVGYRGTYWSETGRDNLTGWGDAGRAGDDVRSIVEGGVTFAGRGTAWLDDRWRHMIEPYFDVLAQKAWFSGSGRPYVFDNLDASVMWEDQFAGRARNLPYTYWGVTPGLRNAWQKTDERGHLDQVLDVDVYTALEFDSTSFEGSDPAHKLAKVGRPNYGKHGCLAVPGARVRWMPDDDISLLARAEYDADHNTLALADVGWRQKLTDTFKWDVTYAVREFRWWDFSSAPYAADEMRSDDLNFAKFQYVRVGFEQQPLDWFAWGPFVRWDIKDSELDCVGTWFDFLTDCLGFRFSVEYENEYTMIDGYHRGDDWTFGFYIYLRALGDMGGSLFH